jgi:hypothetical protein
MRVLLLTLLVFAAHSNSQSVEPKKPVVQNGDRKLDGNKSSKKTEAQAPSLVSTDSPRHEPNSQAAEDKSQAVSEDRIYQVKVVSQPRPDVWYIIYVVCTGIVAVVGIGTLIVVWRQRNVMAEQLRTMNTQATIAEQTRKDFETQAAATKEQFSEQLEVLRQQSESNRISAKAAQQSADALHGIERSRVDLRIKGQGSVYEFTLINYGKTAAKITKHQEKWYFPFGDPSSAEQPIALTEKTFPHTRLLGQNDPWYFHRINIVEIAGRQVWDRLQTDEIRLIIYVTVFYEDFLANTRANSRTCIARPRGNS